MAEEKAASVTRKPKKGEGSVVPPSDPSPQPSAPPIPSTPELNRTKPFSDRENSGKGSGSTIAIRVKPDGSPDLESMHAKTKEKLKSFLSHPATVTEFGLTTAKLDAAAFDPVAVGTIFDMAGTLRSKIYQIKTGLPDVVADAIGSYSETEKAVIVPLAQKVLAKHSSEWMQKWGDEISLCLTLSMFELMKFRMIMAEYEKMKAAEPAKETVKPNGSTGKVIPTAANEVLAN